MASRRQGRWPELGGPLMPLRTFSGSLSNPDSDLKKNVRTQPTQTFQL